MPDNKSKCRGSGITTIITRSGCAVEVVAKRVGFTRGEDGHFRRPGSNVMHRDADVRPIIEIENEG
jgi:hypothetical protein